MYELEMSHINKSFFGVQVLRDVSLRVRKGTIHALIGENGAGKSTLMNILGGVLPCDSGLVKIAGEDVLPLNVRKAERCGVAFVHQEINLFNDLLVYENIFITNERTKLGVLDRKKMIEEVDALFERLGVDMRATDRVEDLPTSKKQLLEISKSLFSKAEIFILDEPTTALNNEEIDNFFRIIQELKKAGKTFIFISHKMPEIFRISDDYTILRNGRLIGSGSIQDITPEEMVKGIVGPGYQSDGYYAPRPLGETILRLEGLSGPGFSNIDLEIRKGEIVGFTGLQGAGSSELMQALFGLLPIQEGKALLHGDNLSKKSTRGRMRMGLGMVPANRKENSVFEALSLLDNYWMASFSSKKRAPLIHMSSERKAFREMTRDLSVKANGPEEAIVSLSGGNQQKVIIGRWLKTDCEVLLLDNPTQGIDVGAKGEIYKLLLRLAKEGKTIIFNTLEIPEIEKCADRCAVFYHGCIEQVLGHEEIDEETVMRFATNSHKA